MLLKIDKCKCSVCGHEWYPRPKMNRERNRLEVAYPKRCAGCKTPYWDRSRKKSNLQQVSTV